MQDSSVIVRTIIIVMWKYVLINTYCAFEAYDRKAVNVRPFTGWNYKMQFNKVHRLTLLNILISPALNKCHLS